MKDGQIQDISTDIERVLVSRILCRYSRKEYEKNKKLYSESIKRRSGKRTADTGFGRPV